jgi:hypothetical protein
MALDETRDERAERHDHQFSGTRIVERRAGQPTTQAQALVGLEDLGVDEGDPPAAKAVLSIACQLASAQSS